MTLLTTLIILQILFIKHWFVDFYNQTYEEVCKKGIYGNWIGFRHSMKHGILTALMLAYFDIKTALILGIIDIVVHYHIDWAKNNISHYQMHEPLFWTFIGLDQLLHYTCYLSYMLYISYSLTGSI